MFTANEGPGRVGVPDQKQTSQTDTVPASAEKGRELDDSE